MKTIYLMRHGQTLFNTMYLNQGQCDSPLTEVGQRQAATAGAWFREHNIVVNAVYSSTQERACDTAEIAFKMPYNRLKGLKEIYLGTKEAAPLSSNPTFPYGDYFVQFGGESLDQVTERVYSTIKKIALEETRNPIAVVSHGMAIRLFLIAIGYEKAKEGFIGNCGIAVIQFDENTLEFHLQDIINFSDPLENKFKGQ